MAFVLDLVFPKTQLEPLYSAVHFFIQTSPEIEGIDDALAVALATSFQMQPVDECWLLSP